MKQLTSSEIRQMFLDFFVEKEHLVVPSASLVPHDDPSLLWINSGVAALKDYFDGSVTPESKRLTNSQKSIRTNDIENVGVTARHHTLFEMLGNFSIGDYFKEEAIVWAWEFLTDEKWLALDPEKLYITVYPEDEEARQIWEEVVGVPHERVLDEEDNFWDIGQGPCGPNTEIFYDRGQALNNLSEDDSESYPGGENERWVEIWNLVFSQYNHLPDGTYEPLPNKNIDTGMGFERLVSIMQDAPTNFETDLFIPLIEQLEQITGHEYSDERPELKVSFKVIADHIRAVTFAVADGALPSNEGRGYVLRRLIRRSVMHAHRLGVDHPFLSELVDTVCEIMGDFYENIVEQKDFVKQVIYGEEVRFHETIEAGLEHLHDLFERLAAADETVLPGSDVFELYDTYGFPVELTEEYAREKGYTVDFDGYEQAMEAQRERARQARGSVDSMTVQTDLFQGFDGASTFVGYDTLQTDGKLLFIAVDDQRVTEVGDKRRAQLIFDRTPFYAESGGQIADHGVIKNASGQKVAQVTDVQKAPGGQHLHQVEVQGELKEGETYHLEVGTIYRELVQRNHTATHLLHKALQEVVGSHATQAGSLVAPDHLRFDFTHFNPLTTEELNEIERRVNEKIWDNLPVEIFETSFDHARELGATALFGEKYGDDVRVVKIGDYSLELCGGTHVESTASIGLFKILSESGIGAGTRRMIARTSTEAFNWFSERLEALDEVATFLKLKSRDEIFDRLRAVSKEMETLRRENESLYAQLGNRELEGMFDQTETHGGYTLIAKKVEARDMDQLRQYADRWKEEAASDVLVLAIAPNSDKVNLLVAVSDEAVKDGLAAGQLIKDIAKYVKGGGGGRPTLAQAGGKDAQGIPEALKAAGQWLEAQK